MSKIKLVHFTSSLKIGGAEKVLFDLVTHLDSEHYDQVVLYIHDGPYREKFAAAGIPTYQVRGILSAYDPLIFVRLWYLLRKLKPDVLHTLLWSANLVGRIVAWLRKIPCICALHNNNQQNGTVRNFLDKCTPVPICVAVSQEVAQSAINYAWVPAKKIIVIQNGVSIHHTERNTLNMAISRKQLKLLLDHFVIGAVGRFHSVKRFDLLLKIFADIVSMHPHARLVIVGIGELEYTLRALAHTLGIAEYVVFIIGKPAHNYYPLFDCFVQTSAQEGISIALLEAMSYAVPCVVMNTETGHTVINHGYNGFVVNATNQKGLIQSIEQLIQDRNLKTQLGLQAQADIKEKFSLNGMIKSYDLLFKKSNKPHK